MRFVVAGGSGFLGSHLITHLREAGHEVTQLVRRTPSAVEESRWHPDAGEVDLTVIEAADVVVNVAGSPTAGNPHSGRWARELRSSRVDTTRVLAEAIAASQRRPALLAGNGISFYGDHGAAVVTEESESRGDALLTSVAREWQAATEPAVAAGVRVCILRTAPVMDASSPPLKQMRLAWRLGLGARLGDGSQYFPMISRRDWVGAVTHLAGHDTHGPFNLCCQQTPTNREFTRALAETVDRRAPWVIPARLLRAAAGPMAPELLGSVNARPTALLASGYEFHDPDVSAVLSAALG